MNTKTLTRIVIVILVIALAALLYMYFFMIPKAGKGGIKSAQKKTVGNIEFLFGIYGPGKGDRPMFNDPMSVATDSDSNIYVTDKGNNRVVVFNRNGEFLFEFGGAGLAHPQPGTKATWKPGTFSFPYGIDIDDETGNIFVADMLNKRIQIFDNAGRFIDWFPKGPYAPSRSEIFPTDIAVAKGQVYIANPFEVSIFTTEGKFVSSFGMPGDGNGQLDRPNGIDVGADGTIYVADSNNKRLQAFDAKGAFKWAFGKPPEDMNDRKAEFGLPRNISVGPDGNIYVADAFDFNIKVFSPEGKKLAEMGSRGVDDGEFNFPNGIAVTKDKNIFVVDRHNGRLQAIRLTAFVIEDDNNEQ